MPPATTIGALAGADLLRGQRHRAQAGAADLVDAEGGRGVRHAGGAGGLARRVLALAGGQHLAEDHFVHVAGLHAGAVDRGLQRDGAERMRGHRAERAVEAADRRAGGGDDDDVVHAWLSSERLRHPTPARRALAMWARTGTISARQ